MKPIKVKILDKEKEGEIQEVVNSSNNLKELVEAWTKRKFENSFYLNNFVCEEDNKTYFGLILGIHTTKTTDLAELYYDYNEVKNTYSEFPLIEELITWNYETDEKTMEDFAEKNGFYYHEYLYYMASSYDKLLPFMMMYALSTGGEAEASIPDDTFYEDFIDDEEHPELSKGKLIWCNATINKGSSSASYDTYFIKE
jgi:hypothetical protein